MIGFLIGLYRKKWLPLAIVTISVGSLSGCFVSPDSTVNQSPQPTPSSSTTVATGNKTLTGSSSYTPYDAIAM